MTQEKRLTATYQVEEAPSRGQERSLSIRVGPWAGAEVRPTRVFVWLGERDSGMERLLTTGREPRLLRVARRRRHLEVRRLSLSYLGNPLVTLVLLVANLLRRPPTRQDPSGARGSAPGS